MYVRAKLLREAGAAFFVGSTISALIFRLQHKALANSLLYFRFPARLILPFPEFHSRSIVFDMSVGRINM